MSICLIIPPSSFLIDERVFMSLGILRIAAVLEVTGYRVEVLDLSGIKNFTDVVRDYISLNKGVTHFGITATTPQMPAVFKIVEVIRGESKAKVILGGSHITLVNAAFKTELKNSVQGRATKGMEQVINKFDTVVAGDGESAIFLALKPDAPKVIDADDKSSNLFLTNSGLEVLPLPARHLVDVDSYHYTIDGVRALSLIAQLGCPFACGFCGGRLSPMLRSIRTRSSTNIVDEMVYLYKTYGVSGFMFYDDELNVNPKILELMGLIASTQKQLGATWRLRGFVKSELFTKTQAEAMYSAGFRWILTGFESGSPRILTNINKKATREENSRCVALAHGAGLKVKALMSAGHPGESEETIRATEDWLLEAKPDDFDLTVITCYPGTPYFDRATPHEGDDIYVYSCPSGGDKLYQVHVDHSKVADYYKGDINGGYKAYVYTDFISGERLVSLRDEVERNVRKKLGIPFNVGVPAMLYEHSMGQQGIPPNILRKTAT